MQSHNPHPPRCFPMTEVRAWGIKARVPPQEDDKNNTSVFCLHLLPRRPPAPNPDPMGSPPTPPPPPPRLEIGRTNGVLDGRRSILSRKASFSGCGSSLYLPSPRAPSTLRDSTSHALDDRKPRPNAPCYMLLSPRFFALHLRK